MAGALILNKCGVSAAGSQPEEDGGGDKARALSSTNMTVSGAWSHPEEDGGEDKSERLSSTNMEVCVVPIQRRRRRGQGRSAYPQPISRCVLSQSEEDGGGDKAGAFIINPKKTEAGTRLEKTETRTRPERLSSTSIGSQVRGLNLKKTQAGTRPERLPPTNTGVLGAYGRSAYLQPR